MATIRRSLKTVEGDMTVNTGDVVVSDTSKGVVMEDQVGDTSRIKIVDDGGVKTIEVTQI